ncbi:MAG: winged helix-turn-helix transcriptional regulator [Lachnospiraceae bacterium]|nr:winged helix-turn-helix transcriptional regulator [Lachnospiraceae bacterium]
MICREIKKEAFFVYNEDIELVLTALLLLNGREEWQPNFYGEEERADWKHKYAVLFEMFAGMQRDVAVQLLDACSVEDFCDFSLELFVGKLQSEVTGRLATELLAGYEESERQELVKSDVGLQQLYEVEENRRIFSSFLSMRVFYKDADVWTQEFEVFVKELRNEEFLANLEKHRIVVEEEWEKLCRQFEEKNALDVSQTIMKKNFYHRGPFGRYVFVPVFMLGYGAMRFYGIDQILLYSPQKQEVNRERLLAQMKTIADETRIRIIKLLNQNGPMCGKDIAQALKLAPSTVSHHIEQLRNAGLLHEEPVNKARYYSVREESKKDFIRLLEEIFQ